MPSPETYDLLTTPSLIWGAGGGAVLFGVAVKLWALFNKETSAGVGLRSDAERITELTTVLHEKEDLLNKAYATINSMVLEKADLHGQLKTLHEDLTRANEKIDKLTGLIKLLLDKHKVDDPMVHALLEAL